MLCQNYTQGAVLPNGMICLDIVRPENWRPATRIEEGKRI